MRMYRFMLAILGILLLAPGCIVISVYPYYSDGQARFDESLVGMWDTAGDGQRWEFSKSDDNRYLITIIEGYKVIGIMEGTLFDAGGYTFMDMYPWDFNYTELLDAAAVMAEVYGDAGQTPSATPVSDSKSISDMDLWWNNLHLMPTHSAMLVVKNGSDTIQLAMLDVEWLGDQLKENPKLIAYELPSQDSGDIMGENMPIMLTASTQELQRFIAKYADDENAFERDTLTRVKK